MGMHFTPDRQLKERHVALPDMRQIGNEPASGGLFSARHRTDGIQGRKRKMLLQQIAADDAFKVSARANDCAGKLLRQTIRNDQFACGKACKLGFKCACRNGDEFEIACRNICRRQTIFVTHRRDRDEHVRSPAVQQAVLRQRPCRHEPDNVARHQCLRTAARLGIFGAFGLLRNRDAVPCLNQPRQIAFGCVHRHAAHRNRPAIMLTARCERDIQRCSSSARIIEE